MTEYYTLYEFLIHSKGWTYTLMGLTLIAFVLFWHFLTGRDDRTGRPD